MNYYISDMHFGHGNVLHFDSRPFQDVETMTDILIHNWNKCVTPEDTVYVLGDGFWKNEENSLAIMKQLNGHKHLIRGNHDRIRGQLRECWESIQDYLEIVDNGTFVVMSHYPMPFYNRQHYGSVMLYGHVHNSKEWNFLEHWQEELWAAGIPGRIINVGCMLPYMDYTPRTLEELLSAMAVPAKLDDKKNYKPKTSYKKLLYMMVDLNLNDTQLSQKAGVSSSVIGKMRRGQAVSMQSLVKVADALGVKTEDISETVYEPFT